jgi:hypothetical protein
LPRHLFLVSTLGFTLVAAAQPKYATDIPASVTMPDSVSMKR